MGNAAPYQKDVGDRPTWELWMLIDEALSRVRNLLGVSSALTPPPAQRLLDA